MGSMIYSKELNPKQLVFAFGRNMYSEAKTADLWISGVRSGPKISEHNQ